MLVMSRRQGETIRIGDKIEIVVSQIGRARVKMAIRAPRSMPVIMREVKLVREENLAAAAAGPALAASPGWIARLRPALGAGPRLRAGGRCDSESYQRDLRESVQSDNWLPEER